MVITKQLAIESDHRNETAGQSAASASQSVKSLITTTIVRFRVRTGN
jgi:hypothetical protein